MYYRLYDILSYLTPIIGHFTELGGALAWPIAAVICVAMLRRPLFELAHAIATKKLPDED